jgi:hypothetical protein
MGDVKNKISYSIELGCALIAGIVKGEKLVYIYLYSS